jgi:cell division protein ZapA
VERLVKLEVLGQEYPFYTNAPPEEIDEILELVKTQLESVNHPSSRMPSHKLAILTSLNMAGMYVKLKRDYEAYRREMDEEIVRLTKKIEKLL